MATCLSEVACVAQLQKVFARVGLLDACIRVVLKSQADFVFQTELAFFLFEYGYAFLKTKKASLKLTFKKEN